MKLIPYRYRVLFFVLILIEEGEIQSVHGAGNVDCSGISFTYCCVNF